MSEISVMNIMKSIVPITRFNKGEANRIFDEVEASGTKIVMKNPELIKQYLKRYGHMYVVRK